MDELKLIFQLEEAVENSKHASYAIGKDKFYPVEIHILTEIREHPNTGVALLSQKMGVTRSAVSQKIKILCEKQYLELREQSGREKFYRVTEKGETICKVHDEVAKKMMDSLANIVKQYSDEERKAFTSIVKDIIQYFKTLDLTNDIREGLEDDY